MDSLLVIICTIINVGIIHISFCIFSETKIKNIPLIYILTLASAILLLFPFQARHDHSIIYISVIVAFLLFFIFSAGSFLHRMKNIIVVLCFTFGIELLANFFNRLFFVQQYLLFDKLLLHLLFLIIELSAILLLLVLKKTVFYKVKKSDNNSKTILKNSKRIIFMFALGMFFSIMLLLLLVDSVPDLSQQKVIIIAGIVSSLCVEGMIITTLFLRYAYKKQKLYTEQIGELRYLQEEHFKSLLKKEYETRKFRHDINKHLLIIENLLDKNETGKLRSYISNIQGDNIFKKTIYNTGNLKTDALTNHYLSLLDSNTTVNIYGLLSDSAALDDLALVIIYGNILQNAVEALSRINSNIEKKLSIEFFEGSAYLRISVENSIDKRINFSTQKSDKYNHGFGLSNVQDYVRQANGEITFIEDLSTFTTVITIPYSPTISYRD